MHKISQSQFEGCLLGLALGDALGAPFEGGIVERLLWKMIGKTKLGEMRWTDDTQMSLDLANSLIERGGKLDPDELAIRFAKNYRWSRGYGPGAAKVLKRIRRGMPWSEASRAIYPEGSYGNGAAMRAPILGLFYSNRLKELPEAVRVASCVTHAHQLAIEGARLIAMATLSAAQFRGELELFRDVIGHAESKDFLSRLETARLWIESKTCPTANEVRRQLGNGIAASESCTTAIYIALRFLKQPFGEMLAFVRACGGDVDTISAMAGAIWGTKNGVDALPVEQIKKLEQQDQIRSIAGQLYKLVN